MWPTPTSGHSTSFLLPGSPARPGQGRSPILEALPSALSSGFSPCSSSGFNLASLVLSSLPLPVLLSFYPKLPFCLSAFRLSLFPILPPPHSDVLSSQPCSPFPALHSLALRCPQKVKEPLVSDLYILGHYQGTVGWPCSVPFSGWYPA